MRWQVVDDPERYVRDVLALRADRVLVDGYARLRALRVLPETRASVLLQALEPGELRRV